MKIIFLVRLFYPHTGGVEKHVLNLTKQLQKKGHEVTVVTEKYKKLKSIENYQGIKIYRITASSSEHFKKFGIWKWILQNKEIFRDADIIHAHDIFYWTLPLKILSPRIRIYTTFHGYEGNSTPGFKERLMHQIAEKLSKKTMSVGRFYTKWYNTKANEVTYGAVTEGKESEKKKRLNSKTTHIVFIGRLETETGIDTYINSIRILQKTHSVLLKVYGDGSRKKEIEKITKKEKLPVKLYGWVKDPQKKLQNTDIVFTSRYLGILEALVMGKYVISEYKSQIKKDYLKMTPFAKYISIINTSEEIANEVNVFLKNPKTVERKVSEGQIWAKNQTWQKLVELYIKLWN